MKFQSCTGKHLCILLNQALQFLSTCQIYTLIINIKIAWEFKSITIIYLENSQALDSFGLLWLEVNDGVMYLFDIVIFIH